MIYFHIRQWSMGTLYAGVMRPDGVCWVFDSYDDNYNPTSVKRMHMFELILDKRVGSIEFGADSVDTYIDKFPEISHDQEDEGEKRTNLERKLYIELLLARLPSEPYYANILLTVHNSINGVFHCSEDEYSFMEDCRELENLGYLESEKVTSHPYNDDHSFKLSPKGKEAIKAHLDEKNNQ